LWSPVGPHGSCVCGPGDHKGRPYEEFIPFDFDEAPLGFESDAANFALFHKDLGRVCRQEGRLLKQDFHAEVDSSMRTRTDSHRNAQALRLTETSSSRTGRNGCVELRPPSSRPTCSRAFLFLELSNADFWPASMSNSVNRDAALWRNCARSAFRRRSVQTKPTFCQNETSQVWARAFSSARVLGVRASITRAGAP
jgi:hypothetical protein